MENEGFVVIAAGVVLFALVSGRLRDSVLTPPLVFTCFGLLIGQAVLGIADPHVGDSFIHGLAEVTLILVLFSDAARIDLKQVRADHDLPVRMLLVGTPLVILGGVAAGLALPLGLGLWEAALLAAILAPTDAALGQSVVSSPAVPARIRQALNIESGLNDGIVLPVVLFFASMASAATGGPDGPSWLMFSLTQIGLGLLAGLAIGRVAGWLMDRAAVRGWMADSFEGAAILGVALLAYSGAELIGGNGFIAAFVCGLAFGNWVRGRCRFVFEFAEAEGQLLVLLTFLIFGAAILPEAVGRITWTMVLYSALSLTVVRMVPIALSLVGSGLRPSTVVFLGWFGPRGLASILFGLFVLEETGLEGTETITAVTITTVALSILAHGITAAPAAARYGASVKVRATGMPGERKPVSEMPARTGMVT